MLSRSAFMRSKYLIFLPFHHILLLEQVSFRIPRTAAEFMHTVQT